MVKKGCCNQKNSLRPCTAFSETMNPTVTGEKKPKRKLKKLGRLMRKAQTNEGGVFLECFSF